MPTITFDRFEGGLDLRQGRDTADANKLRDALNVVITPGRSIRKRPGFVNHVTGYNFGAVGHSTRGLYDVDGLVTAFAGTAETAPDPTKQQIIRLAHPTTSQALDLVPFAAQFAGYLYCVAIYADDSCWHHYLDDPGAWAATTAHALGEYRRPTTGNDLRYEVTTAGTTGGSEPTWPTTPGLTVVDGTVTWTCRSFTVTDANCPHTPSVVMLASKLFAIDGEVVRFCATDDARDWTTASDAGFLATGRAAGGSANARAVASYQGDLLVSHDSAMQVYTVDPDPANMAFKYALDGAGTRFAYSFGTVLADTFYLLNDGFRSLSLMTNYDRLRTIDVGSAIDKHVRDYLPSTPSDAFVLSDYYPAGGMYLCAIAPSGYPLAKADDVQRVYCYAFSPAAKLSAWSYWKMGAAAEGEYLTALMQKDGYLYAKYMETNVFRLDEGAYNDWGAGFPTRVEFPLLDFKRPGTLKQIAGMDIRQTGRCDVSFIYQYLDDDGALQTAETTAFEVNGSTAAGGLIPVELCVTAIAPVFETEHTQEWELFAFDFHFTEIGVFH